jgi:hypothetical protein
MHAYHFDAESQPRLSALLVNPLDRALYVAWGVRKASNIPVLCAVITLQGAIPARPPLGHFCLAGSERSINSPSSMSFASASAYGLHVRRSFLECEQRMSIWFGRAFTLMHADKFSLTDQNTSNSPPDSVDLLAASFGERLAVLGLVHLSPVDQRIEHQVQDLCGACSRAREGILAIGCVSNVFAGRRR